jgi:hypothetical protein
MKEKQDKIFYFPVAIPRGRFNPLRYFGGDHKITFGCKAVDLICSKIDLDTSDIKLSTKD